MDPDSFLEGVYQYYPNPFVSGPHCREPINNGCESRKQGKEIWRLPVYRGESPSLRDNWAKGRGDFSGIIGGSRRGNSWASRVVLGVFSLEAGKFRVWYWLRDTIEHR